MAQDAGAVVSGVAPGLVGTVDTLAAAATAVFVAKRSWVVGLRMFRRIVLGRR